MLSSENTIRAEAIKLLEKAWVAKQLALPKQVVLVTPPVKKKDSL
jgi:hypothetical protein